MNQKYIYGHKETKAAYILDRNNNKKNKLYYYLFNLLYKMINKEYFYGLQTPVLMHARPQLCR